MLRIRFMMICSGIAVPDRKLKLLTIVAMFKVGPPVQDKWILIDDKFVDYKVWDDSRFTYLFWAQKYLQLTLLWIYIIVSVKHGKGNISLSYRQTFFIQNNKWWFF